LSEQKERYNYKEQKKIDDAYLKKHYYNWEQDPRHLKKDGNIPDGRCFHCGRIFLNAEHAIVFCRDCHRAMSHCNDGPDHDFDSFGRKVQIMVNKETKETKTINFLAKRDSQIPVPFEFEAEYFGDKSQGSFKTAMGKPL